MVFVFTFFMALSLAAFQSFAVLSPVLVLVALFVFFACRGTHAVSGRSATVKARDIIGSVRECGQTEFEENP